MVEAAAFSAARSTGRMAGERVMTSARLSVPSCLRLRRCNSPARRRAASALRKETCSRSGLAGLTTKSAAPARMAETTLSMPPWAVCTMTGMVAAGFAHARQDAEPVEIGHHQIEHHAVDAGAVGAGEQVGGLVAALGQQGPVAETLHHGFEQAALDRIVIDDEHGFGHGPLTLYRFGAMSPFRLNGLLNGLAKTGPSVRLLKKSAVGHRIATSAGLNEALTVPLSLARELQNPMAKSSSARKSKPSAKSPGQARQAAGMESRTTSIPASTARRSTRDLAAADADCVAFEHDFKGKLAEMAAGEDAGARLAEAVKRYEALDDLLGRLSSYAALAYAGNTTDPKIAKFYGDVQERLTAASIHVLFFTLELNRIDDAALEAAMRDPALAHYRPWLEDVRKEKPYQLEDRVEQLFHEKSITGYSAWNRQFDELIASLRFKIGGKQVAIEPALNLLLDADGKKRRTAAEALAETFKENLRPFTLITNTLAKDKEISDRWRGFKDVADARHLANRVEREVVDALVEAVRAAYPQLSHRYYALKAKWFGKKKLPYWDRNAPLPKVAQRTISWTDARNTVLTAYGAFSPKMAEVADQFFEKRWIDAGVREGKQPGAFSHPTVPSAHPYVLLNYMGKPRDVMTLAHELGHGVHQVLAAPNGPLMAPTPLDAGRDRERVRRDADLPQAARQHHRQEAAQGHARRQGRGHDQHGGAADRVLHVRAQGASGAPQRRADRATRSASCGCRCRRRAWGRRSN